MPAFWTLKGSCTAAHLFGCRVISVCRVERVRRSRPGGYPAASALASIGPTIGSPNASSRHRRAPDEWPSLGSFADSALLLSLLLPLVLLLPPSLLLLRLLLPSLLLLPDSVQTGLRSTTSLAVDAWLGMDWGVLGCWKRVAWRSSSGAEPGSLSAVCSAATACRSEADSCSSCSAPCGGTHTTGGCFSFCSVSGHRDSQ